jgi:protein gp37
MADHSGIQWTDATWNPVTGCSKVSPGCAHCYAETMAVRMWGKQYPVRYTDERPRRFDEVWTHQDRLDQPLRWKKPRRIFVNSMSDLFHEDVPDAFIDRVFAVMALAPQHTFQILTKRAERMRAYLSNHEVGLRWLGAIYRHHSGPVVDDMAYQESDAVCWTRDGLDNVWLGVSVENQHFADERIPLLLQTPAAVRFISAEPLLGPLFGLDQLGGGMDSRPYWTAHCPVDPSGFAHIPGLDWVIVGGESGAGARPCDLAWVRSIVQQCQAAGVAAFVKQLGSDPRSEEPTSWPNGRVTPYPHLHPHLRDRKGGDPSEWPEDLRVREFPQSTPARFTPTEQGTGIGSARHPS